MNSRALLVGIIVLVLIGAGALFLNSNALNPQPPTETTQPVGGGPGDLSIPLGVKEFNVKGMITTDPASGGKAPRFDTEEIRVKKGDRVRIVFENTEGFHDWTIDEFNARTRQIEAGQTDTVEFVADQAGNFQYYCSVTGHRQAGMVGNLIVEE